LNDGLTTGGWSVYNRSDPAMTKAAHQCFDEVITEFSAEGYGSCCTNTAFMDKVAVRIAR
jgi:4-cresol dehydrogenase (hydroxylating) flavoprotein subunit